MKILFLSSLVLMSAAAAAQPKLVTNAVISTTVTITAPEDEDVSQIQNQGGGFNMRTMFDGETKSTTYIKNDLVKTAVKSEIFRANIFRDNKAKTTTTVFQMGGAWQGFSSSDNDQVEMSKRMDSVMKERAKNDTGFKPRTRDVQASVTVVNTDETKKIAGYNCKKAWVITDKIIAKDSLAVWFTPDIKFSQVSSTGGTSGMGPMSNFMGGNTNFDKIDGFVMQYQKDMPRGRKMEVKVTKIETDKDVADKEFEIPKDVEIKSVKDMQNGGGGSGFRMFGRP